MPAVTLLSFVALLLALSAVAPMIGRSVRGVPIVYGVSTAGCFAAGAVSLYCLLAGTSASLTLPLGLPWMGAHFRVDALAAFFLIVVNLGGGAASLYA